jgi:carboxylate-amine ligase
MSSRSVGVEEELLLVAASGVEPRMVPLGQRLADDPSTDVEHELKLEQAEIASEATADLSELTTQLRARRDELITRAGAHGARVAALGTSPVATPPTATPDERYDRMVERFGLIGEEQLTCGMHVHVGVASRAEGVAVLDRIRVWLPVLTALAANSPFWLGRDSHYASYRSVAWGRWPSAGPTPVFGSAAAYDDYVAQLIESGAALDDGMIYFDARLSAKFPTVEVRVADVQLEVGDAVLVAALLRGLVETAARDGGEAPPVPVTMVRAAAWRAARYGTSEQLFDLLRGQARPAWDVVAGLLAAIGPALADAGDDTLVHEGLARLRARGSGAEVQRRAYGRRTSAADVIDVAVALTAGHLPDHCA